MNLNLLIPLPVLCESFKRSREKYIPTTSGCYVLTTFEKDILYIGLSESLFDRFQQHLGNPEKTNPTDEGRAIWFYFMLFNIKNLRKLERTWLNQFNVFHGRRPILNLVDSPIG